MIHGRSLLTGGLFMQVHLRKKLIKRLSPNTSINYSRHCMDFFHVIFEFCAAAVAQNSKITWGNFRLHWRCQGTFCCLVLLLCRMLFCQVLIWSCNTRNFECYFRISDLWRLTECETKTGNWWVWTWRSPVSHVWLSQCPTDIKCDVIAVLWHHRIKAANPDSWMWDLAWFDGQSTARSDGSLLATLIHAQAHVRPAVRDQPLTGDHCSSCHTKITSKRPAVLIFNCLL